MSAEGAIHQVLNYPAYASGMDDTVVDLVVIQWIMHKLRIDRMRNCSEHRWDNRTPELPRHFRPSQHDEAA